MRTVVYPGTFDPIHRGHIDIAERASKLFDQIIFAVAINSEKNPLFASEERIELILESTKNIPNVKESEIKWIGLDDFLSQIQKIKKMGNIKDLMGMMPGMSKKVKDLDVDDESFKPIESIIYSMTPKERKTPDILNGSRKKRIALGSGCSVQEVNQLLKQFNQMKKVMKLMKKSGPSGMMSALGMNESSQGIKNK